MRNATPGAFCQTKICIVVILSIILLSFLEGIATFYWSDASSIAVIVLRLSCGEHAFFKSICLFDISKLKFDIFGFYDRISSIFFIYLIVEARDAGSRPEGASR